jgi:hypothetical protein
VGLSGSLLRTKRGINQTADKVACESQEQPPRIAALNDPAVGADFAVEEPYRALNEAGRWQAEINRILTANPRLRMHVANRITQRRRRPRANLALWGQSSRSTVIRSRTVPQERLTVKTILKIPAGIQGPPGVQLGLRGLGTSATETYDGKRFGKSVTVMYSNGTVMEITNTDVGS